MADVKTARCASCDKAFDYPAAPGGEPLTCSPFCRRARRAELARDRRYRAGLIEDGRRYRALMAVVADTARGLLPPPAA